MSRQDHREWADACRAQAQQDLAGAELVQSKVPSVFAMLLQMAFEKLGKAALLRSDAVTLDKATSSHASASRMVATVKRNKRLLDTLGPAARDEWRDVMPLVAELERAHPALSGGEPHLEYPWRDASTGRICWPGADLALVRRFADPRSLRHLRSPSVRRGPPLTAAHRGTQAGTRGPGARQARTWCRKRRREDRVARRGRQRGGGKLVAKMQTY